MGALPAILKGFLERVLQPDLVASSKQSKFPKLLKGKSARVIITMGMPSFIYRWWFGAHDLKMLQRNILRFMGVNPIRSLIYGNIEGVGAPGQGFAGSGMLKSWDGERVSFQRHIPEFRLNAIGEEYHWGLLLKLVGRTSLSKRTPPCRAEMRSITFRPY